MKGEEDILANFPIDTSLKKKAHSALTKSHANYFQRSDDGNDVYFDIIKDTGNACTMNTVHCTPSSQVYI